MTLEFVEQESVADKSYLRSMACQSACSGIATEYLERGIIGDMIDHCREVIDFVAAYEYLYGTKPRRMELLESRARLILSKVSND